VETLRKGKSKDITPAVSDAIAKAAPSRKMGKVESVTRDGAIASYETTITSNGQRREVAFSPRGAPVEAD
jgi:hypothetical protein